MEQFHGIRFETPIGRMEVFCSGTKILRIRYAGNPRGSLKPREPARETGCPICRNAEKQILEYLSGLRSDFEVPIRLPEKPLLQKVLQAVLKIPYGKTVSYSGLAEICGCRSVRATATAVGKNPLPILIPCHRVIKKDGSCGQYGFGGPEVKRALLELERKKAGFLSP